MCTSYFIFLEIEFSRFPDTSYMYLGQNTVEDVLVIHNSSKTSEWILTKLKEIVQCKLQMCISYFIFLEIEYYGFLETSCMYFGHNNTAYTYYPPKLIYGFQQNCQRLFIRNLRSPFTDMQYLFFISFIRNIISFYRNNISFFRNINSFFRNNYFVLSKQYFVLTK